MKNPISTIRAIIKNFQSTENVTNLPGRGRVSISSWCTVRRRVWVAKDSPRITAVELQNIVESRGQKTLEKNCQTVPTSPHVVREGFKKNSPSSSKNKLQQIQLSDMTVTSNGTGFYAQMKLKNELFSSKHSRWVWCNRDKKVPHV